ncbi:hypothetical protein FPQ18DRAFT_252837 [Pyronema domesticum]|nr:hypothetical protein FPQ18DRAFT_252837 [Pyronema domesticum]
MEYKFDGEDPSKPLNLNVRGEPRWNQLQDVLMYIAPIITEADADGVDVYFLHHSWDKTSRMFTKFPIYTLDNVSALFKDVQLATSGGTPIGPRLKIITDDFFARYYKDYNNRRAGIADQIWKPMNIICITDGDPDKARKIPRKERNIEQDDLITAIWGAALHADNLPKDSDKLLQNLEFQGMRPLGIQFVQIGRDQDASKYLEKLDKFLWNGEKNLPDIVDTFSYEKLKQMTGSDKLRGDDLMKVIMGGVNKKLDKSIQKKKELEVGGAPF